jgi:hypothetical protein
MTEDLVVREDDQPPVRYWGLLRGERDDGLYCELDRYEWVSGDLQGYAEAVAVSYVERHDEAAASDVAMIDLAVGAVAQVEVADDAAGDAIAWYIFETEDSLFNLGCQGDEPGETHAVAAEIASTLAFTDSVVEPEPAPDVEPAPEIASAGAVGGFRSEVEVADGLLMSADCDVAAWVTYSDGTFREWVDCRLSDAPVGDPEWQGVRPDEPLTVTGGACEWTSDYWTVTDGSEVWATSYELTVTPEGRVFGSSFYASDLLECEA